jgi:hypothetical protein
MNAAPVHAQRRGNEARVSISPVEDGNAVLIDQIKPEPLDFNVPAMAEAFVPGTTFKVAALALAVQKSSASP